MKEKWHNEHKGAKSNILLAMLYKQSVARQRLLNRREVRRFESNLRHFVIWGAVVFPVKDTCLNNCSTKMCCKMLSYFSKDNPFIFFLMKHIQYSILQSQLFILGKKQYSIFFWNTYKSSFMWKATKH